MSKSKKMWVSKSKKMWMSQGRCRVAGELVEMPVEDTAGRLQHILVLVDARSLGWTQLDLVRDFGGGFNLQRVDVTSLPSELLPERR